MSEARPYPRHIKTDAGEIEFRLMSRADESAVLEFARNLPTHDLLFLPRNISEPKVLSAWINEIERASPKPRMRSRSMFSSKSIPKKSLIAPSMRSAKPAQTPSASTTVI